MPSSKFGKRRPKYTPPKVCKKSPSGPSWLTRGHLPHPNAAMLTAILRTPKNTGPLASPQNLVVVLKQQPNPQQYAGRAYSSSLGHIDVAVGFFDPAPGCIIQVNATSGLATQNWRSGPTPTNYTDRVCVQQTAIPYLFPLPASPDCGITIWN